MGEGGLPLHQRKEYVKHFRMWSWRLAESGLEITDGWTVRAEPGEAGVQGRPCGQRFCPMTGDALLCSEGAGFLSS